MSEKKSPQPCGRTGEGKNRRQSNHPVPCIIARGREEYKEEKWKPSI